MPTPSPEIFDSPPSVMQRFITEYEQSKRTMDCPMPMEFEGAPGDIYNPSAPFSYNGDAYIMARFEAADDEFSTQVGFFKGVEGAEGDKQWCHDVNVSNLESLRRPGHIFQDPSVSLIQGEYVVTVVDVTLKDPSDPTAGCEYSSVIYGGESLDRLELLVESELKTKGLRPIELASGEVGFFTRPQAPGNPAAGGLGKIGFTTVPTLRDVTPEIIAGAPLIDDLFNDTEWGGVNHVQLLPDGDMAVLAHIARFAPHPMIKNFREYSPLFFTFSPLTRVVTNQQLLGRREDLDLGPHHRAKRADLANVLYPAFLFFLPDGRVCVGVGVGDTTVATFETDNPLAQS